MIPFQLLPSFLLFLLQKLQKDLLKVLEFKQTLSQVFSPSKKRLLPKDTTAPFSKFCEWQIPVIEKDTSAPIQQRFLYIFMSSSSLHIRYPGEHQRRIYGCFNFQDGALRDNS